MSLSSRRTELQWKQPDHARLQHLVCCRFTLSPAVFQNLIFSILFLHWCDFYLQYVSLWQMGMHQKSMPRVVYELGRITLQDIRRYIENHVVLNFLWYASFFSAIFEGIFWSKEIFCQWPECIIICVGKQYDFHGNCDYMMAKGAATEPNEKFHVTVQVITGGYLIFLFLAQ